MKGLLGLPLFPECLTASTASNIMRLLYSIIGKGNKYLIKILIVSINIQGIVLGTLCMLIFTFLAPPQKKPKISKLKLLSRLCVPVNACSAMPDSLSPMDCSPPDSSVHGILQARILEWVAIPFSSRSSWPRDWTCISCIGRQVLYHWASWEALR